MNLDNYSKAMKINKYRNAECYFQTNTRQRFVNTASIYNSVGTSQGRETNYSKKRRNNEIVDIFDNSIKTPHTVTSKGYKMRHNCETNISASINPYNDFHEAFITSRPTSTKGNSQPSFNLSIRSFDTPNSASSSSSIPNIPKTPNNKQQIRRENQNIKDLSEDKTTYCRPINDMYSEKFLFKTMRRNARLRKIVKRLVIERQKEKQEEVWNNYINNLKNKHGYYTDVPNRTAQCASYENKIPDFISNYYNMDAKYQQSNDCQNLLQDFYRTHKLQPNDCFYEYPRKYYAFPRQQGGPYHASDHYCYPTASQGRLMMLERERKYNMTSRPMKKYQDYSDKDLSRLGKRHLNCIRSRENIYDFQRKKPNNFVYIIPGGTAVQTDISLGLMKDNAVQADITKREAYQQRLQEVSLSIDKIKKQILVQTEERENKPLDVIEAKLNTLIKCIDSFTLELKTHKIKLAENRNTSSKSNVEKLSRLSTIVLCKSKSVALSSQKTDDTFGRQNNDQILYRTGDPRTGNAIFSKIDTNLAQDKYRYRETSVSRIEKIIQEEMEKSKKIKSDIEELLQTRTSKQCSVQISFDIPTKEVSTEVTKSLSKTFKTSSCSENKQEVTIEEINNPESCEHVPFSTRQITIAVNTDPLGLLTLFRMSTDIIRNLLSYMPRLSYSYLQLVQSSATPCITHYVCSICGASFNRPSHLSEHIKKHNLGTTRDCCVCRHVVDQQQHRRLFSCSYCGERFARAYCCELHQQSCATRFGRTHDSSPSLMYLR